LILNVVETPPPLVIMLVTTAVARLTAVISYAGAPAVPLSPGGATVMPPGLITPARVDW
jgi:hypothetical protein